MTIDPQFFIGTIIKNGLDNRTNRVKVMIYGEHDELTEEDQAQLPWSTVMLPTTNAGLPSIGESIGLKEGSTVFGLYVNESDTIILGCMQTTTTKTTKTTAEGPQRATNVMSRTELDEVAINRRARLVAKHGEVEGNKRADEMEKARYDPKNNR